MEKYDRFVKFLEQAEKDGYFEYRDFPIERCKWDTISFDKQRYLNLETFSNLCLRNIPKKGPLEQCDILPNMIFKRVGAITWYNPTCVDSKGMTYSNASANVFFTYQEIFELYEYSTDGKEWHKCEKEPKE